MCKKLLSVVLLLAFSCSLFSQECKEIQFNPFPDLWKNIDLTLNNLEEQTNDMQTLIEKQQKQIQNLENAYQSTYLLYLNSENNSQRLELNTNKLERSLKRWKTFAIVTIILTMLTSGTLVGVINAR